MDQWITVLQNFGLATMLLLAIGLATWRVLVWTGREIIIPMRDKLITRTESFFDKLMMTQSQIRDSQQAMLGTVEDLVTRDEVRESQLKEILAVMDGRRRPRKQTQTPAQKEPQ